VTRPAVLITQRLLSLAPGWMTTRVRIVAKTLHTRVANLQFQPRQPFTTVISAIANGHGCRAKDKKKKTIFYDL